MIIDPIKTSLQEMTQNGYFKLKRTPESAIISDEFEEMLEIIKGSIVELKKLGEYCVDFLLTS